MSQKYIFVVGVWVFLDSGATFLVGLFEFKEEKKKRHLK